MSAPLFSLVVATLGRSGELSRLFASLAAQSLEDFELLVIDQNGDDRLLAPLAHAARLGLPLRHLRHQPPGLAGARNAGLAAARGHWLAFPDDDCWYDHHALARVAQAAAADPPAEGIVARWFEQPDGPAAPARLDWQRARRFREVPVSSITLFLQRGLLDRIGGFDARLGLGQWFGAAEETDLVLRALRSGALLRYEPSALVHHAFGGPMRTDARTLQAAGRSARGTGALYAKHGLPFWVIARGLVAPLLKPLLLPPAGGPAASLGAHLAHGLATARGRLDGWLGWDSRET